MPDRPSPTPGSEHHFPRTPFAIRGYIPPPLTFLGFGAATVLLHRWWPLPLGSGRWSLALGALLAIPGLVGIPAVWHFRRARTSPFPWDPSVALVTSGPFRFTRNPMYLGFALLYASAAGFGRSWWPLLTLPVVLLVVTRTAIVHEERYLEAQFGVAYRAYLERVRRWL